MDRRKFLKRAVVAGTALVGSQLGPLEDAVVAPAQVAAATQPPNILVIMVDQLRSPQWFPKQTTLDAYLPNMARLRNGAVNFARHYTAAAACTPGRSCLLTGLYTHQTACLMTDDWSKVPGLHTGFPTWGRFLQNFGYQSSWYGKWHLSPSTNLQPYGFSGTTYVSPPEEPEFGLIQDRAITDQFIDWLGTNGNNGPWCTTVSLINPHDIVGYPLYTDRSPYMNNPPRVFQALPPNFETPADRLARHKPRLQDALTTFADENFGVLPLEGPGFEVGWLKLLDLYLRVQQAVDVQIGRVLNALAAHPAANRTIVVFTADHGEYGGSHGLRGKGSGIYEEGIRIPLYVKDPTGQFAARPDVIRTQMTSSVDIVPLLLTLASGSANWRTQPQYAHLATRLDIVPILRDPNATGRPYILHTTDELKALEDTGPPGGTKPPTHVVGLRIASAKLGVYSNWAPETMNIQTADQEVELYDYRTQPGQLELPNEALTQPSLYQPLYDRLINAAIPGELRKPLPTALQSAQSAAFSAYFTSVRTL